MSELSGVMLEGGRRVRGPVAAWLVDPSTGVQVTGDTAEGSIVARTTLSDVDGEWTLDLPPNDEISPPGTGWAISENGRPCRVIRKADKPETMHVSDRQVIFLDDSAMPVTPPAVETEVARQIAQLGPEDIGADPAGAADGVRDDLTPEIDARVNRGGDTMAGPLDLGGHPLDGLPVPSAPTAPIRDADRGRLVERQLHGRQHSPDLRGWLAARADQSRPARVVIVADSMGEFSSGWRKVWERITDEAGGTPVGGETPGRWQGAYWTSVRAWTGTYDPAPVGLDARGGAITAESGEVGPITTSPLVPIPSIPTTIDVYYTASPSGAVVEVTIDGNVVGSFDSSLDENGAPVAVDVPGQRWRSPAVGGNAWWSMQVTSPGSALIEGAVCPPAVGVEVHGVGHSGRSTAQAAPHVVAHIEAMTARGEPPDLIVLASDTAEAGSSSAAAVDALVPQLRALAPDASIVWMVPSGHHNWGQSEAEQTAHAETIRDAAHALGLPLVDLYAAMGPVWVGHDPHGWSYDGVHHTQRGINAACDVFSDVLASRAPRADARVADALAHAAQALADAAQGIDDADAAYQLADAAKSLAAAALPVAGGTMTGQLVGASMMGEPSMRAVHPTSSPAGGVAVRLAEASHDSIVFGHFVGIPSVIFYAPTDGGFLGSASGLPGGVQIAPRIRLATAGDPDAPPPGSGMIWLRANGELCYRGPGGPVKVIADTSP